MSLHPESPSGTKLLRSDSKWERQSKYIKTNVRRYYSTKCPYCYIFHSKILRPRTIDMFNNYETANTPSILLATTQQGISGLNSLSSLYQLVRFLYVTFLWTSKTWKKTQETQTTQKNYMAFCAVWPLEGTWWYTANEQEGICSGRALNMIGYGRTRKTAGHWTSRIINMLGLGVVGSTRNQLGDLEW